MSTRLLLSFSPPVARLHLFGGFDTPERGPIRHRVADLLALGCANVEIDASKVTHIDGGCLWELARGKRAMEAAGHRVTVRSASSAFRRAALAGGYDGLLPGAAPTDRERRATRSKHLEET